VSRVTRKEAAILRQRRDTMRRGARVSLETVERQMRADMTKSLDRMAREYDGTPRRAKAFLDAVLIAEEAGVAPATLFRVRRIAFDGLRRSGRAA
jgi:hypothetical protein